MQDIICELQDMKTSGLGGKKKCHRELRGAF